jgi:hypothetical protein
MDEIPQAKVHEGRWRRMRSFVLVGPQHATESPLRWAVTQAMTSAALHLGYFLVLAFAWLAGANYHIGAQIFVGVMVLVASLLFAGIQWVVTLAGMSILSQLGWLLVRLPRRFAQVLGALAIASAAWIMDPIGGVLYYAIDRSSIWTHGFALIAVVLGALWGAWLPLAARASSRTCASPS